MCIPYCHLTKPLPGTRLALSPQPVADSDVNVIGNVALLWMSLQMITKYFI